MLSYAEIIILETKNREVKERRDSVYYKLVFFFLRI